MVRPSGKGWNNLLRVSGFERRTDGNNRTKAVLEVMEAGGAEGCEIISAPSQPSLQCRDEVG